MIGGNLNKFEIPNQVLVYPVIWTYYFDDFKSVF